MGVTFKGGIFPLSAEGTERQCIARAYVRAGEIDPSLTGDAAGEKVADGLGRWRKRRCKKFAIKGGTVCPTHGGSASQVKRAARERVVYARDLALERIVEELDNLDAEIALKAATLAMKYAPAPDEEDELGALRDALGEIRESLRETVSADSA